jgi:hypothetical protein
MKLILIIAIIGAFFPSSLAHLGSGFYDKHRAKKRDNEKDEKFRIVRGTEPVHRTDMPVVLAPELTGTANVGWFIHCHNYPDCPHPKWNWYRGRYLRNAFYEKEDERTDFHAQCLTVDLDGTTSDSYNVHMFTCNNSKNQRWRYHHDLQSNMYTFQTRFREGMTVETAREPPTPWCLTRVDFSEDTKGEQIGNAVVQKCSGDESQNITLDYNTTGTDGNCLPPKEEC